MPESTAKIRLKNMTAWADEPTLSDVEIDSLLDQFRKADSAGVLPDEEGWEPTYNLRAAAREGWKWKQARAAQLISTDLDGDRMSSNQLFEHCARMIRTYSNAASVSVGPVMTEQ